MYAMQRACWHQLYRLCMRGPSRRRALQSYYNTSAKSDDSADSARRAAGGIYARLGRGAAARSRTLSAASTLGLRCPPTRTARPAHTPRRRGRAGLLSSLLGVTYKTAVCIRCPCEEGFGANPCCVVARRAAVRGTDTRSCVRAYMLSVSSGDEGGAGKRETSTRTSNGNTRRQMETLKMMGRPGCPIHPTPPPPTPPAKHMHWVGLARRAGHWKPFFRPDFLLRTMMTMPTPTPPVTALSLAAPFFVRDRSGVAPRVVPRCG